MCFKLGGNMFCIRCGKEIDNDSKFCPSCGGVVSNNNAKSNINKIEQKQHKRKSGFIRLLVVGALLMVALVVMLLFYSTNSQNSDIMQNSKLSIEETTEKTFIPDCGKTEYNTIGNTQANIQNGGYVASQGKWMYYVYTNSKWGTEDENYIYKEPLDGGNRELIFTSRSAISSLNVVGDYIYFCADGTIRRIRCDGENYTDFGLNSRYFYVWNNDIFYVKETKEINARECLYSLVQYNVETKDEVEIIEEVEPKFWALEDAGESVIVYWGEDFRDVVVRDEIPFYQVFYVETEKNNMNIWEEISSGGCPFFYPGSTNSIVDSEDKYVKNKCLYIGGDIYNLEFGDDNGLKYTKHRDEEKICFNDKHNLWEGMMNFIDQNIVAQGEQPGSFEGLFYCTEEEYMNEKYHVINSDIARYIHVAGDWIYYEEKDSNGIFRVKINGTGFEKL